MAPQKSLSARAWAELLLLSLIWGTSFLAIRIALDEITPFWAVAHRVIWAAPVLWLIVWLRRLPVALSPGVCAAFLVMGVLNNVIPFSLQAWAQLHVESGLVAIFNALTAVFGVLVAALFLADERLSARKLGGVLIGFAGVVVALGLGALSTLDLRSLAQIAVIGSTLSYALAGVWARKTLGHLPATVAAAGMLTGSSLVALILAFAMEGPPAVSLAPDTVLAIAYFSLIATAGAYLLYYSILAKAGSGNLMLCTLILTPIAITLGALVRDEALPARSYGGFALVALALLVIDGRLVARAKALFQRRQAR